MWQERDWKHLAISDDKGIAHHMDPYHVSIIYRWIMDENPAHIVEIGAKFGYSTTAMVQARKDGWKGQMSIVDICLTRQLHDLVNELPKCRLIGMSGADGLRQISFNRQYYPDHASPEIDAVIIDGNHDWDYVKEEYDVCRRLGVKWIVAHDVAKWPFENGKHQYGPMLMFADMFMSNQWDIELDREKRPGMRTERGLMIACRK